jgi:short-subunit dehydrogenase
MAPGNKAIAITGAGDGIGAGPARNQRQQPH